MKKAIFSSVLAVLMMSTFAFSGQTLNGWILFTDNSGNIDSMKYENPKTELNVEAQITIGVNHQGIATNGTVVFRNGVVRALNIPQEVRHYWGDLHGPKTFWDYMKQQNKLTITDAQKGKLPATCFGPTVRVVCNDGWEYIGKLVEIPGNADWFSVLVDGSLITVWRLVVREVQQF